MSTLTPVLEALRSARDGIADWNNTGNGDLVGDALAIRQEAAGILQSYAEGCMRNAVYGLSTAIPDITHIHFKLSDEGDLDMAVIVDSNMQITNSETEAMRSFIRRHTRDFQTEDLEEFFGGRHVLPSGQILKETGPVTSSPKVS